jgi:hypothetical protein
VLVLGAMTLAAHGAMPSPNRAERGERFVPRPEFARFLALGFDSIVSDYYWLQAVQIVGSARVNPGRHGPVLGRLVDVATTVNPWVGHPYRFAAIWLTESEASVRKANRLLERGIAYHPLDWRNRFYLGFNQFFYLDENEAAVEALQGAIDLEGAPSYLRRLVARLRAGTGGLETAAMFLEELLRNTSDPYAQADYEKALDEVRTERRARALDAARAEYRRRTGRDIEAIEDLTRGPKRVLRAIPEEPHGWEWVIDPETDRIVSSYYGHRYELHFHATDAARRKAWLEKRQEESEERE